MDRGCGRGSLSRDEAIRNFSCTLWALQSSELLQRIPSTNNGIGVILGGGMDIPFTKMIAWRLFQADYVWAPHNYAGYACSGISLSAASEFEGARLRTGVVLNWGGAPRSFQQQPARYSRPK